MTLYPLKVAISSMFREKWINVLCIMAIATGLFLIGAAVLVLFNVNLATKHLPERFSIIVYLQDGLTQEQVRETVGKVSAAAAVREVRYISKEEALGELKDAMRDSEFLFEGLDVNPLPASLEIMLRKSAVSEATVLALVAELKGMQSVDEVQYAKRLLMTIQSVKRYFDGLALLLIGSLSAAVVFVCYSTVKLLMYRKNEEIETLKLLGATKGFIKSPFLIEGGMLGLLGGTLGLAGIYLIYYYIQHTLAVQFPLLGFLKTPLQIAYAMPTAGLLIGMIGAYIAIGRLKY